ncbi:uncharacterized protein BDV14DRAFT_89603 [Aspergillus stella-maris]|uniref:uncharacterized protein n=1 Tax=Aspergillus stella-maris TaxID=1810926 RepID=UPI003CCCF4F2
MNVFWEKRRVENWKAEILGDPETLSNPKDGCFNMLSLDKSAYALWGAGRFALRPIEAVSSESISVQFFWQRSSSNGVAEIDLSTDPESSREVYGDKDYSIPVFTGKYKDSGEPIYRAIASGDVFTIRTDDARDLPLSSWALLEMQWFLERVAGMSGAAEEVEISEYSDGADTAAPSIDAVRRTREISRWLEVLPQNDEGFEPGQTRVQVYHVTTAELQGTGRQNEDL